MRAWGPLWASLAAWRTACCNTHQGFAREVVALAGVHVVDERRLVRLFGRLLPVARARARVGGWVGGQQHKHTHTHTHNWEKGRGRGADGHTRSAVPNRGRTCRTPRWKNGHELGCHTSIALQPRDRTRTCLSSLCGASRTPHHPAPRRTKGGRRAVTVCSYRGGGHDWVGHGVVEFRKRGWPGPRTRIRARGAPHAVRGAKPSKYMPSLPARPRGPAAPSTGLNPAHAPPSIRTAGTEPENARRPTPRRSRGRRLHLHPKRAGCSGGRASSVARRSRHTPGCRRESSVGAGMLPSAQAIAGSALTRAGHWLISRIGTRGAFAGDVNFRPLAMNTSKTIFVA